MKTIIVLGMHRSATSLLAKGLNDNNIFMGEHLLGPCKGNEKGHFEDLEFLYLNDEILNAAGGSWDSPPPDNEIKLASIKFDKSIKDLCKKRYSGNYDIWGWKDPRTALTIRCYIPYLRQPHFFCAFRDPREVARSLMIRDGMQFKKAFELAKEYNRRILNFLRDWYCNDGFNRYSCDKA